MKTILYRNVEVLFSPDHAMTNQNQQDKLVMAFALVSEFPDNQDMDYWRIEFIGSLRDYFLVYCPSLSDVIRDGEIACPHAYNEITMLSWLYDRAKEFKVATPETLHSLDHWTYSWSHSQVLNLENTEGFSVVQHKNTFRFLKHLDTSGDVLQLFNEAKEISEKSVAAGLNNTLFKNTPSNDLYSTAYKVNADGIFCS